MIINRKKGLIFFASIFIAFATDVLCMQFNKNPTHQTGAADEGFRWRDGLNFRINDNQISHVNWWFAPCVRYINSDNRFINSAEDFYSSEMWHNITEMNLNSDTIHQHLSKIVWNARVLYTNAYNEDPPAAPINTNHQCVAAAALTIVVQDPDHDNRLNAFSCVISHEGKVLVAVSTAIRASNVEYLYKAYDTVSISPTLVTPLNQKFVANLAAYSCTEGQLINKIFSASLLPQTVTKLVNKAREALGGLPAATVYDNIVLVTLHIHTTWDPCAKCSRLLAGISKQINSPEAIQTQQLRTFLNTQFPDGGGNPQRNLITHLRNGNARFFIEVSSNEHYTINADGDNPECSHTECVGKDEHIGNQINITTGNILNFAAGGGNNQLAVPIGNGQANNWNFHPSFPPYVVYRRIGVPGAQIHGNLAGNAAPLNGANNGCATPQPHTHGQHDLPNI
jgi:hypothetical protein